jgi:SAM-dependent methyltransferase
VRNRFYHAAGLGIMAANMVRHRLRGYRSPRPRRALDVPSALRYDRAVVENWLAHLRHHLGRDVDLRGQHVVELGPGQDLGTGLFLLALGAESYTGIDAHPLLKRTPSELHLQLAAAIAEESAPDARRRVLLRSKLQHEMQALGDGKPHALRYRLLPQFDLQALKAETFDLVLSHSSLEHVADPARCFAQLTSLLGPRAHLIAEIDLQTHTRWIRDEDPLNIYRYRRPLYRSLGYSGQPNRVRPDEYVEILERTGWGDTRIYPRRVLDPEYVRAVEPSLDSAYRGDPERLGWLSIVLCASRKGDRIFGEKVQ